jgi:hypothetical protein
VKKGLETELFLYIAVELICQPAGVGGVIVPEYPWAE